jgi:DNA sulfur modification protein DndD
VVTGYKNLPAMRKAAQPLVNVENRRSALAKHREVARVDPVRSAGAEHIVALSLMGALQRNAPLSGPIVMDSPFGRLDNVHTTKVVQALSSMADQVMLLVYESELNPTQAQNQLQGSLRKEYRIARLTARHSELQSIV